MVRFRLRILEMLGLVGSLVYLGFEYAEHNFLGDTIFLKNIKGNDIVAVDWKFALPNGLELTYGQINGLAGDFYGTNQPISDGTTPADQTSRFTNAFNMLAKENTRTPTEAPIILGILQQEVDAVNKAIEEHKDPWEVAYPYLGQMNTLLQMATFGRTAPGLSYLGLAQINWDHFGADARTAYDVGHQAALNIAIWGKGNEGQLELAYATNAFADHFLEDSFASGHLRTPRRALHKKDDPSADVCAKVSLPYERAFIGFVLTLRASSCMMKTTPSVSLSRIPTSNCSELTVTSGSSARTMRQALPLANPLYQRPLARFMKPGVPGVHQQSSRHGNLHQRWRAPSMLAHKN